MAKDLRLALEAAEGLNLPHTRSVLQIYQEGLERGWAEEDFSVLSRLLEQPLTKL